MGSISRLTVASIRNLHQIDISPSKNINLFFGLNGSGKTSLLESIHVLASGRSFRVAKLDPLIQYGIDQANLFAEFYGGQKVGLQRSRNKSHILKLDGDPQRSWEQVARLFPVLVLDSNSFQLLDGGPSQRRQFLDWGVFHVEPSFVSNWRISRRCLVQRNLLLKQRSPDRAQLQAWSEELCVAADAVDLARASYFSAFQSVFHQTYERILSEVDGVDAGEVTLSYSRGWPHGHESLRESLRQSVDSDLRYGATQSGPHRADLKLTVGRVDAADVLSRGQQKLLICALKIAQASLYAQQREERCTYLIDDLPAELDLGGRLSVLSNLAESGGQMFLTSIDASIVEEFSVSPNSVLATFHVERGTIRT